MSEAVATISPEKLAQLSGFSVSELSALASKGHFPRAKNGAYEQNKAIPGCFRAYRERIQEVGTLPMYQSMAECTEQTGIPRTILKSARKESAESFRAHRILLGPLLKWLFSKNGDSENWGEYLRKFQALREEIKYEHDHDLTVSRDEVAVALKKVMALLFAGLDKHSDQLPAILHGMDALGIKGKLSESNAGLKVEVRNALAALVAKRNGKRDA